MSNAYEQSRAFGGVIDVLEAVGAKYAIWGGLAVVVYGEPRFTQDMDILLAANSFRLDKFVQRLQETHYHVDEAAVQNAMSGGFFNVIHLHWHIKTDFYVPTEPILNAAIEKRVYFPFDEMRRAAYITAEDAIITKLRAYQDSQSTRHLDDISSIIKIQASELNVTQIEQAIAPLGLLGVWRNLNRS